MPNTIRASEIALYDLKRQFGLEYVSDVKQFFPEALHNLPDLKDTEKTFLDNVKASYVNLLEHPGLRENMVHLSVIGPLLQLAGFFQPPFWAKSEEPVRVVDADGDLTVEGKLDVLVLQEQFWVLIVESKRVSLSIESGLAQLLAYMLANPHPNRPIFGLLTNGGSFMFIKLVVERHPKYSFSKRFELLNPENDLYPVFQILRGLHRVIRP